MLRREGWHVNHKRIHRLYKMFGLQLKRRFPKKRLSHTRVPLPLPMAVNERWAMDFITDCLEGGRRFRILAIVDLFSRECVFIGAGISLTAQKVIMSLEKVQHMRELPKNITVDNGSEFISKKMDAWAYYHGVKLDFIRPGKPVENAFIESFNGKLRDECLNANIFHSIADANEKLETWSNDYNTVRPHSSLGDLSPKEFAARHKTELSEPEFFNLGVV